MADVDRSEKAWIEAYLAGDQASFQQLYERYRRPLYSYLNRMLPGQPSTVDDLFQKAWIKAIQNLARYECQQSFYAWLVRIAHNTAIDHFRQERRRPAVAIDEVQVAQEGALPWERMGSEELVQALEAAVGELPPDQREVFLLRRQGMPFKEIAELQGAPLNTVLGRMHYAVNKLRHLLEAHRA